MSATEEMRHTIAQANAQPRRGRPLHQRPRLHPQGRRLHAEPAGERRPDRRVAEAARLRRRLADPVPRERRREPRADGLEHAAAGGAAPPRRGAVRRHRHRGDRRARLGRRASPRGARASSTRSTRCASSIRATEDVAPGDPGRRHLPAAQVPALEPEHLHQPASAGEGGRHGHHAASSSPTVPRPISASWRSARTCSSRSCRGTATTTRTRSSSPSAIAKDDVFTSIHIEEFEVAARDTKLGPEEITRDIPNVGEEALRNLDEAGIVYIGAEVGPADILVGKITPKGESPMTPEEKLLRAIFGEKASDVRDTSLRLPPGDYGTVVEVRVFNRHGVDKDERALQIEREMVERLCRDRDDELAILERNIYSRLKDMVLGKTAVKGPKGIKAGSTIDEELLGTLSRGQWWQLALGEEPDAQAQEQLHAPVRPAEEGARPPLRGQGREGPPRRRPAAGRDEDGQGLHRGEAQAAARRQDGRPSRQQGRHLPRGAGGGHAVPRRRHARRPRAEPARRAEPDERRPDPRDPHGLGRARPRPGDRRRARRSTGTRAT